MLPVKPLNTGIKVSSPLAGEMIELSQVNDATFASGVIGKGTAIIPTGGKIVAPFDGVIDAFFDNTMVMAEDIDVKNNRLAILAELVNKAKTVAAFNLLNTK